jgi:hypothetical protein
MFDESDIECGPSEEGRNEKSNKAKDHLNSPLVRYGRRDHD